MLIAQITDLHIKPPGELAYGVVDTRSMLRDCVTALQALDPLPDVVLATGDLVDRGGDDEYALLAQVLAPLTMPVYLVAGNHDERTALRQAFDGPRFAYLRQHDDFAHYAVDLGGLRLLALDTVVPMEGRGELCARRLAWLDARLAESTMPTLVAMHHPPFDTGIVHMDQIGLTGAAEMERIVARHPHVQGIVCGHLHRAIQCRFGGTVASTCPSPAHQVTLDLRDTGAGSFIMEPPGFQLHLWDGTRLVTHTCPIGQFGGPRPFDYRSTH